MLSLSTMLKDILNKKQVVEKKISDETVNTEITTEVERSVSNPGGGSIYIMIKNGVFTNLPPKIGYGRESTINAYPISNSLQVRINSQPIYLGGYGTILPEQTITLPPNSDNYIYLFRNQSDYTKIDIERYDKMLGGNDKDIHFTRILCFYFKTNGDSVIDQRSYETQHYYASH